MSSRTAAEGGEIRDPLRGENASSSSHPESASSSRHPGSAKSAIRDPLDSGDLAYKVLRERYNGAIKELSDDAISLLQEWPTRKEGIRTEQYSYEVRGRDITGSNYRESLSKRHSFRCAKTAPFALLALMEAGKVCSLGSMSHALYDVGGEYR